MKKAIPVLCAIVLIIIIGGVAFGRQVWEKYSYSSEKADLYEYFHIVKEKDVPIVLQDTLVEEKAVAANGVYYFDLDTVHKYFNDRFYVDEVEGLVLFTTPTQVIRTAIGTNSYSIDGAETDAGYQLSMQMAAGEKTVYYIAADYVKLYSNYSYEVFEEPARMQVYTEWGERQEADIKKDTAVRYKGGVKSPILTQVKAGDTVVILETMDTWCKVKTQDAFIGYVENKFLENERAETLTPVTEYTEPEYTSISREHTISMGFHAVYSAAGNDTLSSVTANTKGMNVIAPTWFSLNDNEGNFQSFASASYVDKAHSLGLEVWGVVDDFNFKNAGGSTVDVHAVLSATTTRTKLVENLTNTAVSLKMDGINIDFEGINAASARHFIQFIRELSIQCRKNEIVLSVDNYVPFNFNSYYDLEEQGIVADYVVIMGYDEHWGGGGEAGSVASIDYVRGGLEKATGYIPSKKVINALPFYTRLWVTKGAEVTSEAYPMTGAKGVLDKYGMTAEWDEATSQNYAETEKDGTKYQMWMEDEQSISVKLNVMKNFELGGVAAWRLGYEPAAVWELIGAYTGNP